MKATDKNHREVAGISGSSTACSKKTDATWELSSDKSPEARSRYINERAAGYDFFPSPKRELHDDQNCAWRISPEPFWIDRETHAFFETLGDQLLKFYSAANLLYQHSHKGLQPEWVHNYLDRGKTDRVKLYGLMNRFKSDLPVVIRPDVLLTTGGPVISELDAVPGGIGLAGFLGRTYSELGYDIIGGLEGMVEGFREAVYSLAEARDAVVGIVVSDESRDYRPEMTWVGDQLRAQGLRVTNVRPDQVEFAEEALYADGPRGRERLDIIYRFFELFDLRNIPKIDLILYAIRQESVLVTPPLKSYLEEKMLLALLHHPRLQQFWLGELGAATYEALSKVFPQTWIVDSRPVPPHAVIPGLTVDDEPVSNWTELDEASKSQRRLVLKPSGFSELAWGSRGVVVGHDNSTSDWQEALHTALDSFDTTPYVLQRFHKGTKFGLNYYDFVSGEVRPMRGRARMTPYYFVRDGHAKLGGIMATVTPLNKKLIHGMTEAIMAPIAVRDA